MKPGDYQRYQAELRKPKPVKRLTREEVEALEHQRNLARFLKRLPPR